MDFLSGPGGERRLVLFTRYPEPGRTKTRLIPALGAEGAARLQRAMTERTLARVSVRAGAGGPAGGGEPPPWGLEVRHEGGDAERLRAWLGAGPHFAPQGPGDLGARLQRAVAAAFATGARAVVVAGTDCPELGAGDVRDAFAALEQRDVVLGPAADGGYYLVGVRERVGASAARLFEGVGWGGPRVLEETLRAAAAAGIPVALLRTLADVDRPGDLAAWERALRLDAAGAPISVVVPALDEAPRVGALARALQREGAAEVVVADGGSVDGTPALAAAAGARVVAARRGRGVQLNEGAAAATSPLLLFLHADTRLPQGWAAAVRSLLADPAAAGGAFSFGTDSPRRSLRLIEAAANWRARRLGVVFGDQGLFVRRADFEALGGFPEQPLMEDCAFVRRLRRRGRVVVLPQRVVTSARRWEERGPWRTSATNVAVTLGWLAGVPPARLAAWCRRDRA